MLLQATQSESRSKHSGSKGEQYQQSGELGACTVVPPGLRPSGSRRNSGYVAQRLSQRL